MVNQYMQIDCCLIFLLVTHQRRLTETKIFPSLSLPFHTRACYTTNSHTLCSARWSTNTIMLSWIFTDDFNFNFAICAKSFVFHARAKSSMHVSTKTNLFCDYIVYRKKLGQNQKRSLSELNSGRFDCNSSACIVKHILVHFILLNSKHSLESYVRTWCVSNRREFRLNSGDIENRYRISTEHFCQSVTPTTINLINKQ